MVGRENPAYRLVEILFLLGFEQADGLGLSGLHLCGTDSHVFPQTCCNHFRLGMQEGLNDFLGKWTVLVRLCIVEERRMLGCLHQLQPLINKLIDETLTESMLIQLDDQIGRLKLPGALCRRKGFCEGKKLGLKVPGH
ncbi:hypothetical protein D3C79_869150 [compost metagenome]